MVYDTAIANRSERAKLEKWALKEGYVSKLFQIVEVSDEEFLRWDIYEAPTAPEGSDIVKIVRVV